MNARELAGGLVVPAIRLPNDYSRFEEFSRLLTEEGVPGFIVFGGDAELTPPFLRKLRAAAGRPIFVMADYERGAGQMVEGMPELPPAMALAATRSSEAAWMAGKIAAVSARALSVGVVLAPVLDVLSWSGNPIVGTRAFSDDPDLAARTGLAFVEGLQEEGVVACAKHFPGHGDTRLDSHTDLPRVRASEELLLARELVPFRAAVRAGVGMVMTAFAVFEGLDPERPAAFSDRIVNGILRREWGYGGLVITDALLMEGAKRGSDDPAVDALLAGNDLLLYPEDPGETIAKLAEAIESGRVPADVAAMARGRIAMAVADQAADAPVRKDLSAEYGFRIEEIARRSLTVGADPDRWIDRLATGRPKAIALVLDDDSRPTRAKALDPWRDRFPGGVVHVTPEGTGVAGDLAERIRSAELVVMALLSEVRAAKGRTKLSPELTGFAREVLGRHAKKTLVTVFGSPFLVEDLPVRNVLFAWGPGPVMRRAAFDALFSGAAMDGRLPVTIGDGFPRGVGRGVVPDHG